tara:strand:+ start:376 stop:627 length:252 start_codon:yes stop_codon:yes gene_type:complete
MKELFEGWAKLALDRFNLLSDDNKLMAEGRLTICHDCELRNGTMCDPRRISKNINTGHLVRGCGCNLPAKTLAHNSKCPLGKW